MCLLNLPFNVLVCAFVSKSKPFAKLKTVLEMEMQLNDFCYDCALHQITITLQITSAPLNWIHERSFLVQAAAKVVAAPANTQYQWMVRLETIIIIVSHTLFWDAASWLCARSQHCLCLPARLSFVTHFLSSSVCRSFIMYKRQTLNVRISIHQHDISIWTHIHAVTHPHW